MANSLPESETIFGLVYKTLTIPEIRKIKSLNFLKIAFPNVYYSKQSPAELENDNPDQPFQGPRKMSKNGFFRVRSSTGQTFLCYVSDHFPIRENDVVHGISEMKLVNDPESCKVIGAYYHFLNTPLGMVGTSQKTLFDFLAANSRGKIIGRIAEECYYELSESWDRLTPSSRNHTPNTMSEKALSFLGYLSENIREYSVSTLDHRIGELDGKIIKTLLDRFYWFFLRRRLEILGISRSDIKILNTLGYKMTQIYYLVRKNAFTILPISLEDAISLKNRLGQEYTDQQLKAAEMARKIYYQVIKKVWTGVPESFAKPYVQDMIQDYDMILDQETLYFPAQYEQENRVSDRIIQADTNLKPLVQARFGKVCYDSQTVDQLTPEQRTAVDGALANPISIITGGAGTGKTTIIEQIVENLDRQNILYVIVAYTGKAVCRIQESVNSSTEPMTIHRLCNNGWEEDEPFKHVIIDEASMLTIPLMSMIYEKYNHDFSVTLVGDNNQLPPIEWGYLFQEVLDSKQFPIYRLTKNLRVKNDPSIDGIVVNSEQIVNVIEEDRKAFKRDSIQKITSQTDLPPGVSVTSIPESSMANLIEYQNLQELQGGTGGDLARENFKFRLGSTFQLSPGIPGCMMTLRGHIQEIVDGGLESEDLVIITPFNRHVSKLNELAQELFIYDKSLSIACTGRIYYKQDIVMMTRNDYSTKIMNGTTGKIVYFQEDENNHRTNYKQHVSRGYKKSYQQNNTPLMPEMSGFIQISFITGNTRRYITNQKDYDIYKWGFIVANQLMRMNPKTTPYYPSNSEEEWQGIQQGIKEVYQYYLNWGGDPQGFVDSSESTSTIVHRKFLKFLKVKYVYGWAGDITHGYAMTVHKAEGSEWPYTIIYLDDRDQVSSFLNYHLLYTSITRGQSKVICIGDPNLYHRVALQPMETRYDRLGYRLANRRSNTNS